MVRVGVHVSIAGSIDRAVDRAEEIGCDTFQIFSRNPRGWSFKEISQEAAEEFKRKLQRTGIGPAVDHMPYLPNFATPKEEVYQKSVEALALELERCEVLGIPYLVTHLGSHLDAGKEEGLRRTAEAIKKAISATENGVILLLETTSGSKNSVGGSFEDLADIMRRVDREDRVAACFDTCHAFAAGYEVRSEEGLEETLEEFDEEVGLEKILVVHLNDSKGVRGSKLDRHEHIGLGAIGEDGFRQILRHPAIRGRTLILETPVDDRRDDRGNIAKVRELAGEG
jgi:deoxyribonuclease-4